MNDEAYTLHLDYTPKTKGTFQKGHTPWNKGLTWEQQGWTPERRKKVVEQLRINKSKNTYTRTAEHLKRPVIQMDDDGNRLHWYPSSEAAARKLCVSGRNIRKVCSGERKKCGGFRWKWDERFLT